MADLSGNGGGPKSPRQQIKALEDKIVALKRQLRDDPDPEPEPEPPASPPAQLSLCDLARRTLDRALENWASASGRTVSGYKIATRAVTYLSVTDAFNAVNAAIQMVIRFCGPGALPEGLEEFAGGVRRVIPSDV
jgi:hypothetical protein